MVTLLRRAFTEREARSVADWSYPPPYDIYDADPAHPELFLRRDDEDEGYYPAVDENGTIVAFAVFGTEARVWGQQSHEGILDVGAGVRPDLTSRGLGSLLINQIILLGRALYAPVSMRTAVAAFNTRSLALCTRTGFRQVREFTGPGERKFHELARVLQQRD